MSLSFLGEIKLPKDYCCSDLDLDAEFEVILPRRQGLGLCGTALVSYLISLHNKMVYTVQKFSNEDNRWVYKPREHAVCPSLGSGASEPSALSMAEPPFAILSRVAHRRAAYTCSDYTGWNRSVPMSVLHIQHVSCPSAIL